MVRDMVPANCTRRSFPARCKWATVAASGAGSGLGTGPVVPPPVQLCSAAVSRQMQTGFGGGTAVVPPPVQLGGGSTSRQTTIWTRRRHCSSATSAGTGGSGRLRARPRRARRWPWRTGRHWRLAAPPNSGGNGKRRWRGGFRSARLESWCTRQRRRGSLAMSPEGRPARDWADTAAATALAAVTVLEADYPGKARELDTKARGHGSDPNARGGISPFPGRGGAGNAPSGDPAASRAFRSVAEPRA